MPKAPITQEGFARGLEWPRSLGPAAPLFSVTRPSLRFGHQPRDAATGHFFGNDDSDLPSSPHSRLTPFAKPPEVPAIAETIVRSSLLSAALSQDAMSGMADYRIDFDLPRLGLLDWDHAEEIIELSAELASRTIEGWRRENPELPGV